MSFTKGVRAVEIELLKCDACGREVDTQTEDFTGWASIVTMDKAEQVARSRNPLAMMQPTSEKRSHACDRCAAELETLMKAIVSRATEKPLQ